MYFHGICGQGLVALDQLELAFLRRDLEHSDSDDPS
jgi:hypothetical protein